MSRIVERMSDDAQERVLARFDYKPATTPAVIDAHEEARARCAQLANWAMQTLPPGDDLNEALVAIEHACRTVNAAIAQTQLMGDVERMLAARKTDEPSPA